MPIGSSPYREAQLQGRLWTPELLADSGAAWFDTSNGSSNTFTSGTYVAVNDVWRRAPDMVQGTTSLAPSISSINGRPCDNFDKTNGLMLEFYAATSIMANTFTVAIVCAVNAIGTNARALTFVRSAGGNDYDNTASIALLSRSAVNTIETYFNSGQRATTTIVDGAVMLFVVECDGTNVRQYLNGAAGGSGTLPSVNLGAGQFAVGCYSSGGATTNYQGLWGEMVAVREQSDFTRQNLEGYLAWRWGLQSSLASSHPYKNDPPTSGSAVVRRRYPRIFAPYTATPPAATFRRSFMII